MPARDIRPFSRGYHLRGNIAPLDADHGIPSWMTFTRGAGNWSRQTAPLVDGTTPIEEGTAQNSGRFSYCAAAGRLGLLIEPAHTNVMGGNAILVDAAPNDGTPDGWTGSGATPADYESQAGGLVTGHEKLALKDTGVVSRGVYINAGGAAATYVYSGYYRRSGAGSGNAESVNAYHENGGAWIPLALALGPYDWTRQFVTSVVGGAGIDFYTGMRVVGGGAAGLIEASLPQLETGVYPKSWTRLTCPAELCAMDAGVVGAARFFSVLVSPQFASTAALSGNWTIKEWAPGWRLDYDPADDAFKVYVAGVARATSAAQSWAAGDLRLLQVRYGASGQQLSVNGTTTSDATAWGAPVLAPYLGSRAASANCEAAIYMDVLEAP